MAVVAAMFLFLFFFVVARLLLFAVCLALMRKKGGVEDAVDVDDVLDRCAAPRPQINRCPKHGYL